MRFNYALYLSILAFLSCSGPDEVLTDVTEDMEQFDLKYPAKVIREYSMSYVDSAGVFVDSFTTGSSDNYYFDSSGTLTKGERWNNPANKHFIETWTYDSAGRKSYYKFERGPSCSQSAKYFYDDKDRLIRKEIYSSLDSLMNIEIYRYNTAGRLIQKEVQGVVEACGYELPNNNIYEYGSDGRMSRTRSYSENRNTDQSHTYVGDTIFHHSFGTDYRSGNFSIKSDYDSKGAWTKSVFMYRLDNRRKQYFQTTRTIEYY